MNPHLIPDIFQAHLHNHNKVLQFPHKMAVNEFIKLNKDILKEITAKVGKQYGINPKETKFKYYFRKGTENYLRAENMLVEENKANEPVYQYGLSSGVKKH
ncbi:MAG: hypothetical protein BGO69_15755 [Bacteroidetes bacterium 46-16]|nr:MAG: hypothetical protein BGO69_15755 [Bacteroidetes bacterium 46-16]